MDSNGAFKRCGCRDSRSGRLLGTGTLASLTRATRPVTVILKAPLKPGTYRATARGGDALGHTVRATPRDFKERARQARFLEYRGFERGQIERALKGS